MGSGKQYTLKLIDYTQALEYTARCGVSHHKRQDWFGSKKENKKKSKTENKDGWVG